MIHWKKEDSETCIRFFTLLPCGTVVPVGGELSISLKLENGLAAIKNLYGRRGISIWSQRNMKYGLR